MIAGIGGVMCKQNRLHFRQGQDSSRLAENTAKAEREIRHNKPYSLPALSTYSTTLAP